MKRNKIKIIALVLMTSIMVCSSLGGCNNSINYAEASTAETQTSQSESNNFILGKVAAINNNEVTLAIGENTESSENKDGTNIDNSNDKSGDSSVVNSDSKKGANPKGNPTEDSSSNNEKPHGTPPDGSGNKDKPKGNPPDGGKKPDDSSHEGMSKAKSTFTLTGETKTVDLNNEYNINIASGSKTLEGSIDDVTIGSILKITYDDEGNISDILVNSNNTTYTGGSQTGKITLTGENIVESDSKSFENDTLSCTSKDSAVLLSKDYGNAELNNCTINKSGDTTSNDESNFYGINSGVVAANGSKITIKGCTINTDSEGSNGIFSTGDGSYINADNIIINTSNNSSRGLDATYNGTIIANNPTITTQGEHCAALATDRGEGTIHVNGGVMKTAGAGSPGIYSTGKITAKNASFTATGYQGAVIEGKNSITVTDCDIIGYKNNGAMLYQSFSGDSGVGTSYFNMNGGTFTAMEGPMFYVTNTDAEVNLNNASLDAKSGILINCAIGRWGKEGSNGGNLKMNAYNQVLNGDIMCDNISSVNMNLESECNLTGAINSDNTGKELKLYLDNYSSWNVTKTSYLTVIKDTDDTFSNIIDNGNTIYYDSSNSENDYLEGKTITLSGGGKLAPLEK